MSSGSAFLRFWWTNGTRSTFLCHIPKDDLPSFRLSCYNFSVQAAPLLFQEITVTFRGSTFSKPTRMAALERIGSHIQSLTFRMPHTAETFLPPLLNPVTGEEEVLIYTPQIDCPTLTPGSKPRVPKYGTWELTDHLIKQYSPLFHAATNVSAFIRAFTATPLLVHLKVSCPGQDHAQRYRRSAVDYALTSLRIAVERAPLMALTSLSLLPIHPMGLFYLRPMLGLGSLPNSRKRWAQIHELAIQMESYFSEPNVKTDQLKILHSFLEGLSPGLVRLLFQWRGSKGPCPLSLDSEVSSEPSNRLFGTLRPLRLSNLKYMELENILIDASQVSTFISRHRRTLKEFDFERVTFRTGDWDEALAPLTKISGSEDWKKKQLEVMDVPCVMIAEDQDSKTRRPNLEKTVISEENKIGGLWRLGTRKEDKKRKFKLENAGYRRRQLFGGGPGHMKKFLRNSVLSWR